MDKRYAAVLYPFMPQYAPLAVAQNAAQTAARRLRADGMVVVIVDADTLDGDVLGTVVAIAYDQERFFPHTEGGPA
ncbi:MAG: hypothetical protein HC828_06805 [Blastochloris sp.]|nr:hypothetical protein [Blastochloris sp.]